MFLRGITPSAPLVLNGWSKAETRLGHVGNPLENCNMEPKIAELCGGFG